MNPPIQDNTVSSTTRTHERSERAEFSNDVRNKPEQVNVVSSTHPLHERESIEIIERLIEGDVVELEIIFN